MSSSAQIRMKKWNLLYTEMLYFIYTSYTNYTLPSELEYGTYIYICYILFKLTYKSHFAFQIKIWCVQEWYKIRYKSKVF
jgi:hypothetical protein